MSAVRSKVDVYPLSLFTAHPEEESEWDPEGGGGISPGAAVNPGPVKHYSAQARSMRLKSRIDRDGAPVRSVEGVLLVHVHNHPHVLLFRQRAQSLGVLPLTGQFGTSGPQMAFRLPGGKCRKDESEVRAMYRKLGRHLLGEPKAPFGDRLNAPVGATPGGGGVIGVSGGGVVASALSPNEDSQPPPTASRAESLFRVGEVLAQWYRPSFDRLMYPYLPPHIIQAKETRTVFLIHITMKDMNSGGLRLAVGAPTRAMELVAVPLFELLDNAGKYGAVASSIPHVISRLHVNYC
jgi:cleavage and polyadenylation specificity factor subunit 5